jgi:hypothetical protein
MSAVAAAVVVAAGVLQRPRWRWMLARPAHPQ